jgi:hypothetical protein
MEKIMNKIKNLLDLANNNPNENEAIAAALKAQELMAKNNIELAQLDDATPQNREIAEEIYRNNGKHDMKKWRYGLAGIIAKNFRCEYYFLGRQDVVFYGYKEDAKIALQVFAYLYEIGNKLAFKKYYDVKKQDLPTKGVMNTYLIGFRDGIKSDLEKQCTALMIVTPQEVTDKFEEKAKNFKSMTHTLKILGHSNSIYNDGFIDGKNAVQSRALEAAG